MAQQGRKKLFDEKQRKTIATAFAHGASVRDLSSRFNCNQTTIRHVLREMRDGSAKENRLPEETQAVDGAVRDQPDC